MYAAGASRGRNEGGMVLGEWTSLENEGNGRSDELRRNSQAVRRSAEGWGRGRLKPRDDTWGRSSVRVRLIRRRRLAVSRLPIPKACNWAAIILQRGWNGRGNDRWETVPPVIGALAARAPLSYESEIILARRSDTTLESRRHEVTSLRLLSLSLSLPLSFPLFPSDETCRTVRKLPHGVAVASQPFNHRYGSRSRGKLICITALSLIWFRQHRLSSIM